MVEVKALDKKNNEARFLIKGVSPAYINTLRRLIINKVPTMALEDITFIENGGALYDEILALRLGLVPIKTDLSSYEMRKNCKCKGAGCANCTLKFTLDVKGPKTVYASDLKSADPKVVPVYPKMVIAKLLEGQTLKLEADAILSNGKDHIKFSPGLVHFRGYPNFKIKAFKNIKQCEEACPKNIIKAAGDKVKITKPEDCILCRACEDVSNGGVQVNPSNTDFVLIVESWGQLEIKEILTKGLEIFNEELEEFEDSLKKVK